MRLHLQRVRHVELELAVDIELSQRLIVDLRIAFDVDRGQFTIATAGRPHVTHRRIDRLRQDRIAQLVLDHRPHELVHLAEDIVQSGTEELVRVLHMLAHDVLEPRHGGAGHHTLADEAADALLFGRGTQQRPFRAGGQRINIRRSLCSGGIQRGLCLLENRRKLRGKPCLRLHQSRTDT